MRALIVGAGWFGCEIARILEDNEIEFDIVDKTNTFFLGHHLKIKTDYISVDFIIVAHILQGMNVGLGSTIS